jgi:hypothetical protein
MKKTDILSIQIESDIEDLKKSAREGYYTGNLNSFNRDFLKVLDKMIKRNEAFLGIKEKHYCTKCGEEQPNWEEDSLCGRCI